ncbi:unnamed protein product [Ilex paraguariensis]|uniref:RHOMBOID-like protein n=1 Tax=Ilex paraguariensis TaxID=185542 RepID=A0ABC8SI41_9AQUA
MAEPSKSQTQIEMKQPPTSLQPRISIDLSTEDLIKEQRVPLFGSLSRGRENTWVISLFVILHLVAFAATMLVNDCWQNSHGECALKPLGRLSFQPLSENPLFVRIGIIYILSAFTGSMVAALFLQDRSSVTSSGALFGLLGAMLSGLIRNWKYYTKKFPTLVAFLFLLAMNLVLGLLPHVNNFSNVGGFISGFLLGFVLLFSPRLGKMVQNKSGLFDYGVKGSLNLRQKLDRPVLRSISLVLFSLLLAGVIVAVLHGINMNKYCSWCRYIDCVPFKWWSCNDKTMHCETMISSEYMTLTCANNGKFRDFPFANVSQARIEDLCNLICS